MRPAEEIFTDEVVFRLMAEHKIPKLARQKFEEALWAAHGVFEGNEASLKSNLSLTNIPKRQTRITFYNQLSKIDKIFSEDSGMVDLLAACSGKRAENDFKAYASWSEARDAVKNFRELISQILPLAEAAQTKIKRGIKKRNEVRRAAQELIYFLDKDLERPLSMQDRGVVTEALRFVHDCLSLMDPSITKRLLEDVDSDMDSNYWPPWLPKP
ncbi:MAG: hypothetical protein IIB64_06640 [Proteobacteria bacterium]|nr:hypothetical protein [Pseudomonadota bacterium]